MSVDAGSRSRTAPRTFRAALRAVGVLLIALVLGCINLSERAPRAERPPSRGLAYIAKHGEIRIGTSGEQPPLTMTTRSGELVGLDIAFARVLAQAMGVEPRFVTLPFGSLVEALEAGEVDLVMSGMTITPARSQRVAFVGPYYTSGKALLTRSTQLAAAAIPEDLDRPALRFAALAGSTSELFVEQRLSHAQLVATQRLEEAVAKLLAGEVDALVADHETCHFATLRYPSAGLLISEARFSVEPMGIAVALDDPRLANLVQTYLDALEQSGALEKARTFWFEDQSWVGSIR